MPIAPPKTAATAFFVQTYDIKPGKLPALEEWFRAALASPWETVARLIPDEQPVIEATLRELAPLGELLPQFYKLIFHIISHTASAA